MRSHLCLFVIIIHLAIHPAHAQSPAPHTQQPAPSSRSQQQSDTLILHFGFNQYALRQADADRLDRFLYDRAEKTGSVFFIGYTDTIGTPAYNQRLSLSRAQTAARHVENLSPRPKLQVAAKGEAEPLHGDDSLNRRVTIIYRHQPNATTSVGLTGDTHGRTLLRNNDSPTSVISPPTAASPAAVAPDTTISLTDINFIEDTPTLTESSRMVLPAYINMLKSYKASFLEIDGYCNSPTPIRSTSDPLFKLSVQRAKLIFDYLVEEGFDPARLSYKGMGNATSRNAAPATADEARANMRVEVRIFRRIP